MIHQESHAGRPGETSFLRELVRQLRAPDALVWDGKDDLELLAPFLAETPRARAAAADEPDPDVFWRLEVFHAAVGRAIEARTGIVCTPMMRMHHAGSGRVVLLGGRLVVVNRFLHDPGQFRFESLQELVAAGERLVAAGVAMIERHPEAAHHPG